jgi:monovalent cation/proton antiporter MnhG/PhaG subunit
MDATTVQVLVDLSVSAVLLVGLFFMLVGAIGLHRLPDAYNRLHGASICVTLGLTGMLIAAAEELGSWAVVSKALMTLVFTFVATPIGSHLLAKAAHHGRLEQWDRTLGDELAEDKANPDVPTTDETGLAPEAGPGESRVA